MSVWSAHCALGRRSDAHGPQRRHPLRPGNGCPGPFPGTRGTSLPGTGRAASSHGEGSGRPEHAPIAVPAAGAVRWERPHDQERRRRRLIGGA
ncbi:hypothetical protein SAMN04489712_102237 [Thermomonospora echinospora]|uniref:Uncharacterized protein n=1 Tax=Thermomonospora echinospora TaxID=1992 RepID=A0A1H5VAN4_9ACTN|nr:hypothetical protein [Thermomonospora echinospora]SEF84254.1 hypothetical protein SAMN04489712_102237 [Thermomonospora echinospora]